MIKREVAVLDAPSNLGLRPPEEGAMPGCYKLPWALRNRGLLAAIGATDAGCVIPPRYRSRWVPGEGDRNAGAIASFSVALANRLEPMLEQRTFALVLGGDCSILVGNTLALKRRGRFGLVFLDAHSDFRHPQNAQAIGAAAGEDLAIVTGRGDSRLIDLESLGPYVREEDVAVVGIRPDDAYLDELAQLGIAVTTSVQVAEQGVDQAVDRALETVTRSTQGFWVHLDCDVLDASDMPAVDSPAPNGLSFPVLTSLLRKFVASPHCAGLELTIYDPDLDPTGQCADQIAQCVRDAFRAESDDVSTTQG